MTGWEKWEELLLVGASFPIGCLLMYYAMASKRTLHPLRIGCLTVAGVWLIVFAVYMAVRFL